MKYYFLLLSIFILISCGEKRDCSFATIEDAVDCACELSIEKEAAKSDKEILDELKKQTKSLNEDFDKAISDSIFTEEEFIKQLRAACESF